MLALQLRAVCFQNTEQTKLNVLAISDHLPTVFTNTNTWKGEAEEFLGQRHRFGSFAEVKSQQGRVPGFDSNTCSATSCVTENKL